MKMISPGYMHIMAYPLAYTKSTKGTVSGTAVILPNTDSLPGLKGKLRGKVLLLAEGFRSFNASQQILSERLSKEILQQAAENPDYNYTYFFARILNDSENQRLM